MRQKIKVHEKALAHLSRGLYRSPASALRELVSNAWDANATVVRVSTNYPEFLQLSIEDNGDGFSAEDFDQLMSGGVGNSQKRISGSSLKFGRPIIGRLGIGMLGIAQICGSFVVVSKSRGGSGFRARVNLYDLIKERLDRKGSDLVVAAAREGVEHVEVGEYEFEEFDKSDPIVGTRILTDDLHPTFIHTFRESLKFEQFVVPNRDWARSVEVLSRYHSLQQLGDYWRLLWELAAACPIPYLNERALPSGLVRGENRRLADFQFKLIVDSIDLRKPVRLAKNPFGYSTHTIKPQVQRVYGKSLRFHGYIVVQEGLQLKPDELRGIMVRIKDVAIGYYDPSLLDYRFNEGPRSKWVTGEIFVDEGLEDALNIDRDSFNRFHPHFRAIQTFVHDLLRHKVFPDTYKKIDKRSTKRRVEKERNRTSQLKKVLATEAQSDVKISKQLGSVRSTQDVAAQSAVSVSKKHGKLHVSMPVDEIETKKSNRHLAASVLAIFEIALRESDRQQQRELFTRMLLELLRKW